MSTKKRIIEIRSYNLKPGTGQAFHKLIMDESIPMLKRWNVDVLAFGPSLHDKDSYLLVRSYKDLTDRQQNQDAFYGSDEWMLGPREVIMALIENYTTVVMAVNDNLIEGLRIINTGIKQV